MIPITRLDGSTLVVNADLIETIERSGDTVVTLVSGNRFVVRESVSELTDAVIRFRAGVLLAAEAVSQPQVVPSLTAEHPAARASASGPQGNGGGEQAKIIPLSATRRSGETD